jgi:hypothetical protein
MTCHLIRSRPIAWLKANVDPNAHPVRGLVRHKYLMPLDPALSCGIGALGKPYPKKSDLRAKQATSESPSVGGGAEPTRALQPHDEHEQETGQAAFRTDR